MGMEPFLLFFISLYLTLVCAEVTFCIKQKKPCSELSYLCALLFPCKPLMVGQ